MRGLINHALAALLCLCALAPAARAQATLTPAAQRLANEGSAALQAGQTADALARFEQAYRLSPAPELLRRLGQVAQAQDRTLQAADLFRRYLQEAGPELDAASQQALRELVTRPFDSSDEVAIFGDEGALVLLDDRVAGTLPLTLPLLVSAGSHKLRVEKGRRRVETRVKLLANRPVQVRVTLVPPVAVVTPTAAAIFLLDAGDAPEALVQRLSRAASQAAAQERILLLPADKLAALLAAAPELRGCLATRPCQERLAAQIEARYVVSMKITREAQGARWDFTVTLYDVRAGAEAATAGQACAACTVERAGISLGELVSKVAQEGTTRPRGSIEVSATPAGAAVQVDGRALGLAPAGTDAFTGPHEVRVTLQGHTPFRATATVNDGETARVQAQLQPIVIARPAPPPVTPPVTPPARRPAVPLYKKPWFWAVLGGAVLLAGATTGLVLGLRQADAPGDKIYPNPIILTF